MLLVWTPVGEGKEAGPDRVKGRAMVQELQALS